MKKYAACVLLFGLVFTLPLSTGFAAGTATIAGNWSFSVDMENGRHGEPLFVFKQQGDKLSGKYTGPLGEYDVSGTIKGDQATFAFRIGADDQAVTATFSGKVEGESKMTGTVEFSNGVHGKWVASKR